MSQRIVPLPAAADGCSARVGSSAARFRVPRGLVGAGVLVVLVSFAAPLAAQSRGALQVAAQVLLVEPSSGALAMGMGTVRSGRVADTGALAAISVTPSAALPAGSGVRQPRAVLTIAFVRN